MLGLIIKALLTAGFIVLVSEIAKRSTLLAAILVALPLATIMTVAITFIDTRDAALATRFANTTFLLVWPGLLFFIGLPVLQKLGLGFPVAFVISVVVTIAAYAGYIPLLRRFGVTL